MVPPYKFQVPTLLSLWRRLAVGICLLLAIAVTALPVRASIDNDRYDGNIFALYGSNGSIVPPRVSLADSIAQRVPTLLVFYVEDSSDCKRFAAVVGNLQVRYGLGVNIVALNIDALATDDPNGPGQYFDGRVPQTLFFDPDGRITYNQVGDRPITEVENTIRAVYNLEPVAEGDLRRQPFNELQTGFGR
ncbi:thylakoid membrane photosystem I accumulation factor [Synechococcus sp. PCC 7336]|uniref:thylakoid membrane photosystem I accumulation factor n=1 Tax=Synechococcus sp. PCC 7336 TaxID=195250 RepID=UPI0003467FA3|nr:thylakoid membrane photosystem I accumulation factor [Synechococcus sp. PCC 7336]